MPGVAATPASVHEVLARFMLGDIRAGAMGIAPHRVGV